MNPTPRAARIGSAGGGPTSMAREMRPALIASLVIFVAYAGSMFEYHSAEQTTAGVLVTLAAILPFALWTVLDLPGLPLFPGFAATSLQWNAIPLLTGNLVLARFSPATHLQAGLTVAGFLFVATIAWLFTSRRPPAGRPTVARVMSGEGIQGRLLTLLGLSLAYNVGRTSGWLPYLGSWDTLVVNTSKAVAFLSMFVLWFEIGVRSIRPGRRAAVITLTSAYTTWTATGLMLSDPFTIVFGCALAFTVGRRRIPYLGLALAVVPLALLHPGKYDMREAYRQRAVAAPEYPEFFSNWVNYSVWRMTEGEGSGRQTSTAVDRSSSIQMLMLVQSKTPDALPFMGGRTYEPLPEMLVPRVLYPGKPKAHVGTYMLSVYYGLQDEQSTASTTIAFSLESEAYANFGYLGVACLGLVLGSTIGWATARAGSGRVFTMTQCAAIVGVSTLCTCFASAAILVSTLAQTLAALYGLGLLVTHMQRTDARPVTARATHA